MEVCGRLHDHDKSASIFVKKYKSRWGQTLFGRCLGPESSQSSASQKTKFAAYRYAQAAHITEESRVLYLLIKVLKHRPPVSKMSSPTKMAISIQADYRRVSDRVRDDPYLAKLTIPLPNINAKSITTFFIREQKRANFMATTIPAVSGHKKVLSTKPMPAAPELPKSLSPPPRPVAELSIIPHESGVRTGTKRRLTLDDPPHATKLPAIQPRPAPVLVVVP